jgi:hypothetical protein
MGKQTLGYLCPEAGKQFGYVFMCGQIAPELNSHTSGCVL